MAAETILGRYRYLSRLGAGGSSTVVLAEDTLLGRRVALKRMHVPDDLAARSRLRREALIGASLGHPNLVSVFDVATTEDGDDVIVMEYVEGEDLAEKLGRGDKPATPEALRLLDGLSSALDTIHPRGIVHRDVKPANVLLGVEGVVKLADLGIAAVPDGTQITTGDAVLGTFRYMAPEQLEGKSATPAIDIYALSAVAYEVLSGEKARHEPNPLALAHAIATQPPPDLRSVWPDAPAAAAEVLMRGMAREPKARPRSAGELTARLRAAFEPQTTAAVAAVAAPVAAPKRLTRPAPAAPERRRPRRRGAAPLVAAGAALVAAAAIAAIVLASSGTPRQRLAGVQASRPPTSSTRSKTTPPTGASAGASAGSPASAVESFYHLAASHRYAAAWALADPAFRQQMQGYGGLEGTMSQTRSITFDGLDVVNQSPNSATVAVRTTSIRTDGSQSCSGTVSLLRAGSSSPDWLLDHIDINCA